MDLESGRRDHMAVGAVASVIIAAALIFLMWVDRTYVHIDAIAHVNKARNLFDNYTPGIRQFGSNWLPLPHLLIAPLTWIDVMWSSGLAGSLLSAACYVGTSMFLFRIGVIWTGFRVVGWIAFLLFALNPRLIYLFTTPMTEPLMVFCTAALAYYIVRWTQTGGWYEFAIACLVTTAGTLTRYEGWTIAAATVLLVPALAVKRRMQCTILFAGAAALGPMLWMIFNMVYFDDPLIFAWGRGSARDYAQEHLLRTGKMFATAGDWYFSFKAYFIDVAYCLNPVVLWLGLAGIVISLPMLRPNNWRATVTLLAAAMAPFAFYVYNLYDNVVPLLMPGLVQGDAEAIFNVRYGTVMTATIPLFAAVFLFNVLRHVERRRAYSLFLLAPLFFPDPIPSASVEPLREQLTNNLFYKEGVRNQSFWMPAFVEIGQRLKSDIDAQEDASSLILTNTRVIHPVVWAAPIPIRRFIHEMNGDHWGKNLNDIQPEVRWAITEEGDQLWHAKGRWLRENWTAVAAAKASHSSTVHLFRRPE